MTAALAEYFTYQFYIWEYRGRGWFLAEGPVLLEPPFIPFYRHLPQTVSAIDDGKRPTIISSILESFKKKKKPGIEETDYLDYETIEPFVYNESFKLSGVQINISKERIVTPENMKALLIMLSSLATLVSFEIIGNSKEIVVQFACCKEEARDIKTQIKAYFPELFAIENQYYIENILDPTLPANVIDFGLQQEFVRPLAISKNFKIDPLTGIIGILEHLTGMQKAGIQILFSGAVNSWSDSVLRSVTLQDGKSFFADAPESPKLAFEKIQSPFFGVTIRAFAQGENNNEAGTVLSNISHALMKTSASQYNALIPIVDPEYNFQMRIDDIYLRTSHRLGMLLNSDELVNLLHFPSESIQSRKLIGTARKTKETPALAKDKSFVLGKNPHNGLNETISTGIKERLKHTHIIGATGTGKSTLLLSMIVQDIEQDNGVAVLDPHGDLIDEIISHIPTRRIRDVIILDPSDSEFPVGFNILQAHSDIEREILSSDLVAVFRRNSTSWGDQMNSVFGNALIAFLESSKGGTLADLRRFLIEKSYRKDFLHTVNDPSIKYYWYKEYPFLKTSSIGPILTRLDTFLRPKLIRNVVCQQKGLDFENILDSQKILLVKLSQGLIGIENSYLLGSFVVSKIQQSALARQANQHRKNFFFYIDEFQHFITPSMAGILSGARKYHVGLVLAHQDMQQLMKYDSEIASSVIGNAGTRICFRVGEIDAKRLAEGFTFFESKDLQNLDTGEAIIRIERPEFDFSLSTIIPEKPDQGLAAKENVLEWSRKNFATPKREVEQILAESMNVSLEEKTFQTLIPKKNDQADPEPPTKIMKEAPAPKPAIVESPKIKINHEQIKKKEETQHRYLQTLIKRMAESRGFKATIEAATPDGKGKVDVLLERESLQIACEVSITTDTQWELHNIQKCLNSGYGVVVSCMTDNKAINQLQNKLSEQFTENEIRKIKVLEPDALFSYLDSIIVSEVPTETTYKGYRVKVNYDSITGDEMKRKRESVAKIIVDAMKKMKK